MARKEPLLNLDKLLVRRGIAANPAEARDWIQAGRVLVDGIVIDKPTSQVRQDRSIKLLSTAHQWVGRGALKLLGVLDVFGVNPSGKTCADLGASTGGFTEVLLERGARRVYAIDVGRAQLAWKLQTDERVVVMDETNARHLRSLPDPIDLVVGDLSFISVTAVLPAIHRILSPDGQALLLVKPQFEVLPDALEKGGKVRCEKARLAAIDAVVESIELSGFLVLAHEDSPVPGARAGNVEHFVHLRCDVPG